MDVRAVVEGYTCPRCGYRYRAQNWEDLQPVHGLTLSQLGFLACRPAFLLTCFQCLYPRHLDEFGQDCDPPERVKAEVGKILSELGALFGARTAQVNDRLGRLIAHVGKSPPQPFVGEEMEIIL